MKLLDDAISGVDVLSAESEGLNYTNLQAGVDQKEVKAAFSIL